MPQDVYKPFDADVDETGGYLYASGARRSAACANRRFTDVILSSVDLAGKRVVDVGCGDGTYTFALSQESGAASVLGIDPAQKAIARAQSLLEGAPSNLSFRAGFALDLIREGARFDVAVYRGVIHHVGDPQAEVQTALALADRAFFLEPNGWNVVVKLLEKLSPYHRRHRERSYVLSRYRRWIEKAGGRVERAFFFGLVPMFSPDWMVTVGCALEPVVEKVPGLRVLACGQVGILAASAGGNAPAGMRGPEDNP